MAADPARDRGAPPATGAWQAAAAAGVVPVLVLGLLIAGGRVRWPAGLLALGVIGLGACAIGVLWARDLARLESGQRPVLAMLAGLASRLARQDRRLAELGARATDLELAGAGIVERLPDPLLMLDAEGALLSSNAAARAAFGDAIGAVLRHPVLRAAIEAAFAAGALRQVALTLPVPVERAVVASVVFLDPPPGGARALVVLSDRTREQAVERMRADFVANASHELRTPLASLSGFIETLSGPAAEDEAARRRFLPIMAEQAARMARLIEDLLSLSRIEMSEHEVPVDLVAPGPLAMRVLAGFEPRLAARRITPSSTVTEDLPPVAADADQIAQVLTNLLDNAMVYGRQGGVVRLSVTTADPARWPGPGVVLAVADDGPGIPRAHLPRLTERFYRVDAGRSRAAGGTGLGLAIVKHIVSRHRGRLLIESEDGRGTTVSVWLPAAMGDGAGAVR